MPVVAQAAACAGADAGKVRYVSPNMEYCDANNWMSMDVAAGGACTAPEDGKTRYTAGQYEFCNSSSWRSSKSFAIGLCLAAEAGKMAYAANLLKFCDGSKYYLMTTTSPFVDYVPSAFSFTDATAAVSTLTTSDILLISGYHTATLSISGASGTPQFRVCNDASCTSVAQTWGTAPLDLVSGQYVQLRMTSSASLGVSQSIIVDIGGVTDSWTVNVPTKGFFILSSAGYDGNDLGSLANATTECLNNVVTQNFYDKASASIDASTVEAFLCVGATCNNLMANTTYTFGVAGDPAKGGATFTTDGSGRGPGNSTSWNIASVFGSSVDIWMSRATVSATLWATTGNNADCTDWTSTAGNGNIGRTGFSNANRWVYGSGACATPSRIICAINPADKTPATFDFTNQTGIATSTVIESNIIQITGLGPSAVNVSASGSGSPEVRVCSDAACSSVVTGWTAAATTILNNEYLQVRQTSSASAATSRSAVINVGTLDDVWSVTTP